MPLTKPGRIVAFMLAAMLAACQSANPAGGPSAAGQSATTSSGPPASAAAKSSEVERLIAAARAAGENELAITGSNTLDIAGFEALFNQTYGTQIKITYTAGPGFPDMAAKVAQELAGGRKASSDILILDDSTLFSLLDKNLLEAYDYTAMSPRITQAFIAPDNLAVQVSSQLPAITYNTKLIQVAESPQKMDDVLNPKWKGKIASTSRTSILADIAMRPNWGADKMRTFVTRLSENASGLLNCGEVPRVGTGEFLMFTVDCGTYTARQMQAKGEPVTDVIPVDGAVMFFWYLGVPRNAAHPNLAKLYINLFMSEAGQKLFYDSYKTDLYSLAGSRTAAEVTALESRGADILKVDINFDQAHSDIPKLAQELLHILQTKGG